MASKRIKKELCDFEKNPAKKFTLKPASQGDWFNLESILQGPQGTPYEGGQFSLKIQVPKDYPFRPPKIQFITPIYHVNSYGSKKICCCVVQILQHQWSPALTIQKCLEQIYSVLENPQPDSCGPDQIKKQFKNNKELYYKTAKLWTQKYAKKANPESEAKSQ